MMAILPRAEGPLILIIGSADVSRSDYNPPLLNAAEAPGAATKIGEALAKAGCRIVVFSSDPAYVEADVVRGFVNGSTKTARRQIQVRAPQGSPEATFHVPGAHSDIFDLHPDQDSHWVAPFYRAIRDADGVIIIGGGRSALIMGHLALAMGLPLLTPACFGGSARHVWAAIKPGDDLPTQEERNEMGKPDWRPEYATRCVSLLNAQIERRKARLTARARGEAWRAGLAFVLVGIVVVLLAAANGFTPSADLLFGIGPVAGMAGALTRSFTSLEDGGHSVIVTLLFGAVSGLMVSLVYLVAQLSAAGGTGEIKQLAVAVVWMAATAFGAGFVFDRTLKQLAEGKLRPGGRSAGP